MGFNDEELRGMGNKIHRTVAVGIGYVRAFDSVAVSLQNSEIIARNFRIRNYNFFIGSQGKKSITGQIGRFKGQGAEAVCNRRIISHGKTCAKILCISGGVNW